MRSVTQEIVFNYHMGDWEDADGCRLILCEEFAESRLGLESPEMCEPAFLVLTDEMPDADHWVLIESVDRTAILPRVTGVDSSGYEIDHPAYKFAGSELLSFGLPVFVHAEGH